MDPITTALVVALATGVAGGAGQVGKEIIVDAYAALKDALKDKCGVDSKVMQALDALEEEPDFEPNQTALAGRMEQAEVTTDSTLLNLAETLLSNIKEQPGGETHIQNAVGNYNAQADRGGTASVTVNQKD